MNYKKRWLTACVAGAFALMGAASAQAAQTFYPDAAARTFDSGPAGYAGSTSSEGLCVTLVNCPFVTNSFQPSGGVADSGHIRTSFVSLATVGGSSSGTWTSPAFVYNGVDGVAADELTMTVARRADVSSLLAVAGNSATYSVELLNVSGGAGVSVINRESLAGLSAFADKSVDVNPSLLTLGGSYRVQITSRFEAAGAQVLPGGSVDYDNVRLSATRDSSGGGGGNGGGGSGGGGGNGGGALAGGGTVTIANTAVLRGSKLLIKVRCARKPSARCTAQVDARFRKSGPSVTNKRVARVPAGKVRRIALDIRPRHLAKVEARKRIIVKQRSKQVGQSKARTTYKLTKVRISQG